METTAQAMPSQQSRKVFESRSMEEGHHYKLEQIKLCAGHLLDAINNIEIPPENREVGRLVSLANTDLESCVMWAVKAISRYNP